MKAYQNISFLDNDEVTQFTLNDSDFNVSGSIGFKQHSIYANFVHNVSINITFIGNAYDNIINRINSRKPFIIAKILTWDNIEFSCKFNLKGKINYLKKIITLSSSEVKYPDDYVSELYKTLLDKNIRTLDFLSALGTNRTSLTFYNASGNFQVNNMTPLQDFIDYFINKYIGSLKTSSLSNSIDNNHLGYISDYIAVFLTSQNYSKGTYVTPLYVFEFLNKMFNIVPFFESNGFLYLRKIKGIDHEITLLQIENIGEFSIEVKKIKSESFNFSNSQGFSSTPIEYNKNGDVISHNLSKFGVDYETIRYSSNYDISQDVLFFCEPETVGTQGTYVYYTMQSYNRISVSSPNNIINNRPENFAKLELIQGTSNFSLNPDYSQKIYTQEVKASFFDFNELSSLQKENDPYILTEYGKGYIDNAMLDLSNGIYTIKLKYFF